MSRHFTDAERRAAYEESMRLLRDAPAPRPAPEPPPREVHIQFEDDVAKWKREADEFERKCEEHRTENRREGYERAAAYARQTQENELAARMDALEARVDALESMLTTFANGTQVLGDVIENAMVKLDGRLAELSRELSQKFAELRALEDVRGGSVIDLPDYKRRAN